MNNNKRAALAAFIKTRDEWEWKAETADCCVRGAIKCLLWNFVCVCTLAAHGLASRVQLAPRLC